MEPGCSVSTHQEWDFKMKNSVKNIANSIVKKCKSCTSRFKKKIEYFSGFTKISYNEVTLRNRNEIPGSYLVATKKGLYHLKNSKMFLVMEGQFYGITLHNNRVFVFQKINRKGRLIEFYISNEGILYHSNVIMMQLSEGCHQIDWINGQLLIMDSYNNRILSFNLSTGGSKGFFPLGYLREGRQSHNYAHMNSILKVENYYLLYCHNETKKTGRPSSILVLSEPQNVLKEIQTTDENGHNIVAFQGRLYHCDSMNGTLKADSEVVFKCPHFTRGLSINKDVIIVGGSEYAERSQRQFATGHLYVLSLDHKLLDDFPMPGMVQEVRRIDAPDYSLSQHSRAWDKHDSF